MADQLPDDFNSKKKRVSFSHLISFREISKNDDSDESNDKYNDKLKTNTILNSQAVHNINRLSDTEFFSNTLENSIHSIDEEMTHICSNENSIDNFNKTTMLLDEHNSSENNSEEIVKINNENQNTLYFSNDDINIEKSDNDENNILNNNDTQCFYKCFHNDGYKKKYNISALSSFHKNENYFELDNIQNLIAESSNDLKDEHIFNDGPIDVDFNLKDETGSVFNANLNKNILKPQLNIFASSKLIRHSNVMPKSCLQTDINKNNEELLFKSVLINAITTEKIDNINNLNTNIYFDKNTFSCTNMDQNIESNLPLKIIENEKETYINQIISEEKMDTKEILINAIPNPISYKEPNPLHRKLYEIEQLSTNKENMKPNVFKSNIDSEMDINFIPDFASTGILDSNNIKNLIKSQLDSNISFKEFQPSNESSQFVEDLHENINEIEEARNNYLTEITDKYLSSICVNQIDESMKTCDPILLINTLINKSNISQPYIPQSIQNVSTEMSYLCDEQMKTFEQNNKTISDFFPNIEKSVILLQGNGSHFSLLKNKKTLNNSNSLNSGNSNFSDSTIIISSEEEFNNINNKIVLNNVRDSICDDTILRAVRTCDIPSIQRDTNLEERQHKTHSPNLYDNSYIKLNHAACLETENAEIVKGGELNKDNSDAGIMMRINNVNLDANNRNDSMLIGRSISKFDVFDFVQPMETKFDYITLNRQEYGNGRSYGKYKMVVFDKIKHSSSFLPKYRLTWNSFNKFFLSVNDFLLKSFQIYKEHFEEFFPENSVDYKERIKNHQMATTISDNITAIIESSKINFPNCDVDLRSKDYAEILKIRDNIIQLHIDLWHILNDLFEWNLQYVNEMELRLSIGLRNDTINIIFKLASTDLNVLLLQPFKISSIKIKIDNQNLIKDIDMYFQSRILDILTEDWLKERVNNLPKMVNDISGLVVTCRNFKNSILNQQYSSANPNGRLLFFTYSNDCLSLILWDNDCAAITMTTSLQLTGVSTWSLKCKFRNSKNIMKCNDISEAVNNLTFCSLNYMQNVFNCFFN